VVSDWRASFSGQFLMRNIPVAAQNNFPPAVISVLSTGKNFSIKKNLEASVLATGSGRQIDWK